MAETYTITTPIFKQFDLSDKVEFTPEEFAALDAEFDYASLLEQANTLKPE